MGLLSGLLGKVGGLIPGVGTVLSAGGLALDLGQRLFAGRKQKKLANQIQPVDPEYTASPYAQQGLMRAKQLYNSRMPGATQQEQRILTNTANAQAAAERNSGSGADNLAMAAILNAQGNEASAALGEREAQNKLMTNQILTGAEGTMINEGNKVFEDKLRKYTEAVAAKNTLMDASYKNTNSFAQSMAQGGLMLLGSGLGQNKANASGSVLNPQKKWEMATVPTAGRMAGAVTAPGGRIPSRSFSFMNPADLAKWKANPGG